MVDRVAATALRRPASTHAAAPVMQAGRRLPTELRHSLATLDTLTDRELTVLRMLAAGMDNRGMARHLGIREATVKRHMTTLLAKLGLVSRLQAGLVAFAVCLDGVLTWYDGDPDPEPPSLWCGSARAAAANGV